MPHLLAKLNNVSFDAIKELLCKDAAFHASQGMYLEHIWQNADDNNQVLFLFKIEDVEATKNLINKLHTDALAQNPDANLPIMTYLQ
jgi:hypothetical protein